MTHLHVVLTFFVDKAMELRKTSTLQQVNAQSSMDEVDNKETRTSYSERDSWEDDGR
jgi:hypothetical protein